MTTRDVLQSILVVAATETVTVTPTPPPADSNTASLDLFQSVQFNAATQDVTITAPESGVRLDIYQSILVETPPAELPDLSVNANIPVPPAAANPFLYDYPVIHIGQPSNDGISRNGSVISIALADNIPAFVGKGFQVWIDHSGFSDLDEVVVELSTSPPTPLVTLKPPNSLNWPGYALGSGSAWYLHNFDSLLVEGTVDPDNSETGQRIKVSALDRAGRVIPQAFNAAGSPNPHFENPREFIHTDHAAALVARMSETARRARKAAVSSPGELRDRIPDKTWYMGLLEPLRAVFLPGPPLYPKDDTEFIITNGRDSTISLSAPFVPTLNCLAHDRNAQYINTRKHRIRATADGAPADTPWPDLATHEEVRVVEEAHFRNRMLFTGVLLNAAYVYENLNHFIQISAAGMGTLMSANNFFNVPDLYTPGSYRGGDMTLVNAIYIMAHTYAIQYSDALPPPGPDAGVRERVGWEIRGARDIIDSVSRNAFLTRLPYWWTNWEPPWQVFSRIVQTEGPPASFWENNYGKLKFFGRDMDGRINRPDAIGIGSAGQLPLAGPVVIRDHVSDIVNDAQIVTQLKGFILPGNTRYDDSGYLVTNAEDILEGQNAGAAITRRNMLQGVGVGKQLIAENFAENYWYQTGGGARVIPPHDNILYRVENGAPFVNPSVFVQGASVINPQTRKINASTVEVILNNISASPVAAPAFLLYGTPLQAISSTEHWTSQSIRQDQRTLDSIAKHRYRLYQYGGYDSIYATTADELADRIVIYYRDGLRTVSCTVEVPADTELQEAAGQLEPLHPIRFKHPDIVAPINMLIRSINHRYIRKQHFIDLELDENIDDRLS